MGIMGIVRNNGKIQVLCEHSGLLLFQLNLDTHMFISTHHRHPFWTYDKFRFDMLTPLHSCDNVDIGS